jgi:hypothetical protein
VTAGFGFAVDDMVAVKAVPRTTCGKLQRYQFHPNTMVGNLLNMIAARTAHALNLKGPALTIDTACSSSLVAVHLAGDSLRRGGCEVALAGGVSLNLSRTAHMLFSRAGALSPTGRCRAFDAAADGDPVLAVIRRSSINNDGRSLAVMAPNAYGQRAAIAAAYGDGGLRPGGSSGLRPADVQYVEAHGTGTALGDPSELRALARVYGEGGVRPGGCVVGSVKANIGHLLAAAGAASLIKPQPPGARGGSRARGGYATGRHDAGPAGGALARLPLVMVHRSLDEVPPELAPDLCIERPAGEVRAQLNDTLASEPLGYEVPRGYRLVHQPALLAPGQPEQPQALRQSDALAVINRFRVPVPAVDREVTFPACRQAEKQPCG